MTVRRDADPHRAVDAADLVVEFSLVKATVMLHEPVLLALAIHNRGREARELDLGYARKGNIRLLIARPRATAGEPCRYSGAGAARSGRFTLPAAATYQQMVALDAWYRFAECGHYAIDVQLRSFLREGTIRSPLERLSLSITNPQASRLATVYADLADRALRAADVAEAAEYALALGHARHPAAVPALRSLLQAPRSLWPTVIPGLRRIADREAILALLEVVRGNDGEASALACSELLRAEQEVADPQLRHLIRTSIERAT